MTQWFLIALVGSAVAERVVIERPDLTEQATLWRITHDPRVEHYANYHLQPCWSPDGRYLCYTLKAVLPQAGAEPLAGILSPEQHVYDFSKNEDRRIGPGAAPNMMGGACWAHRHNWLFFVSPAEPGDQWELQGAPVIWLDLASGKTVQIGEQVNVLGGVDFEDQWVYGARYDPSRKPPYRAVRMRIGPRKVEELPAEVTGFQFVPNPRYPVMFSRHDHPEAPFDATRYFFDLDGRNRRIAALQLETAHMCWLGDGRYLMVGDYKVAGRQWDQPAPSNLHLLAAGGSGTLGPCDRNGRYVCTPSFVYDLRSGDGWRYMHPLPPNLRPAEWTTPIADLQNKGSPDGTKVSFCMNYDIEKGPRALVTQTGATTDTVLHVDSTRGFPESGELAYRMEVIGYRSKTATRFEGLQRGLHGTPRMSPVPPELGLAAVTLFQDHCLTDEQWATVKALPRDMRLGVKDPASPLRRQRQNDVYVALVRRPDRPVLLALRGGVQIIPGESHEETAGYHLLHNGRRLTKRLVRAGETGRLTAPGQYQAISVEWSGVESEPSEKLNLTASAMVQVLGEPPQGFSWTSDRWLVNNTEKPASAAAAASEAVREMAHQCDRVIAREWYRKGVLTQRHDLNRDGKAIRRTEYENGKIAVREYHDRDGRHASTERFDAEGNITERIVFHRVLPGVEQEHWYFDHGTPVRCVLDRQHAYLRQGDQWNLVTGAQ